MQTNPSTIKRRIRSLTTPFCTLTASFLILSQPARADYIVTLQQVGSDVVATGSGAIDLTGLTFDFTSGTVAGILPIIGLINVGPTSFPSTDHYSGTITGPPSFGLGKAPENAFNGSGDLVGIFGLGSTLTVPQGYVSGSPLSDSATYAGTFGFIGLTPGTYKWTWGTGANQSFTLQIGPATVPDSGSTLGLLLLTSAILFCARQLRLA
jgi:hypothetical protein